MFRIVIKDADTSNPAGKLADAEIHFTAEAGDLAGLRLIGFAVWERRSGNARRNVTFPARTYSVNGDRRSFALLRPSGDTMTEHDAIRDRILAAYEARETEADDNADRMQGGQSIRLLFDRG